jgi:hypothetical protein
MDICPGYETQWNTLLIDHPLKFQGRRAYLWTGIVIKARQDMRRASDNGNALLDRMSGNLDRDRHVRRPVIDPWQDMAMKINHFTPIARGLLEHFWATMR